MFKPRFLMSERERRLRDARYGDLVSFRADLLRMSVDDKAATQSRLLASMRELHRTVVLDLVGVLCLMLAFLICFGHALLSDSLPAIVVDVLILPAGFRLFETFGLSRDTYFGQVRRLAELRGEPVVSRFDDE